MAWQLEQYDSNDRDFKTGSTDQYTLPCRAERLHVVSGMIVGATGAIQPAPVSLVPGVGSVAIQLI